MTTTDDKEYPPEIRDLIKNTKKKLDEIFDDERRIIKKLVWSLYEDYGLSPGLLRSAFQSVILDIEAEERKYEELEAQRRQHDLDDNQYSSDIGGLDGR